MTDTVALISRGTVAVDLSVNGGQRTLALSLAIVAPTVQITITTGTRGPIGLAGPKGDQGEPGPPGNDGAPGAQGPAGTNGVDGAQGAPGPKGDKGDPGADGAPGDAGAIGPAGPQGPPGNDGAQGPIGPAGADGAQGPQGIQGPIGATGAAGADGAVGPAGPQGIQGDQGIQGPPGPSIITLAVKTADESRFAGTKSDDGELSIAYEANSIYRLDVRVLLKMQSKGFQLGYVASEPFVSSLGAIYSSSAAPNTLTALTVQNSGTTTAEAMDVRWAILVTGANPGTLTLQWGSSSAGLAATATILHAGSYLQLTKLA